MLGTGMTPRVWLESEEAGEAGGFFFRIEGRVEGREEPCEESALARAAALALARSALVPRVPVRWAGASSAFWLVKPAIWKASASYSPTWRKPSRVLSRRCIFSSTVISSSSSASTSLAGGGSSFSIDTESPRASLNSGKSSVKTSTLSSSKNSSPSPPPPPPPSPPPALLGGELATFPKAKSRPSTSRVKGFKGVAGRDRAGLGLGEPGERTDPPPRLSAPLLRLRWGLPGDRALVAPNWLPGRDPPPLELLCCRVGGAVALASRVALASA
mmetsp:Transcript_21444/g.48413  ORF Transcript_21444/g.48413 Transcript_21444/m.48413 type:complete len:272 (+) Transcript_21444:700-1515(+)